MIAADPRTDLFNPNAIRASLGTIFALPVVSRDDRGHMAWLRERGIRPGRRDRRMRDRTTPSRSAGADRDRPRQRGGRPVPSLAAPPASTPIAIPMHGIADSLNVSIAAAVVLYEAGPPTPPSDRPGPGTLIAMDTFDFVIIGAGPAGEAAAYEARELGRDASPSSTGAGSAGAARSRLHALEVPAPRRGRARGQSGDLRLAAGLGRTATTWSTARTTETRATPATSSALEDGRRDVIRGTARIAGRVAVEVAHDAPTHELAGHDVMIAVGSTSEGAAGSMASTTSRRGRTARRRWPASCRRSLLVLGGGPTGASSPRSSRGSACRRRSSSRARG